MSTQLGHQSEEILVEPCTINYLSLGRGEVVFIPGLYSDKKWIGQQIHYNQ